MPDAAPPILVPSKWGYTAVAPGAKGVAAHALCGLGQRTWPRVGWLCLPGCPRFSFRHGLAPYAGVSVPEGAAPPTTRRTGHLRLAENADL